MTCGVCGAGGQMRKGMCNLHYRRVRKYGDPQTTKNRKSGEGTPHIDGYWMFEIDGRSVLRHVLVAERILGRRLPHGAQVHHIDGDRSNDAPSNLVICPSAAYHQLLHKRQRALEACGNASWLKCQYCKKYSPPEEIRVYTSGSGNKSHPECRRAHALSVQAIG